MKNIWYATLAILLIISHLSLYQYAHDDAYIHFRIAQNWINFGSPLYNPDTPGVMTSSSPIWTLFLTILFLLFGTSLKTIAVANALISTATTFTWATFLKTIKPNLKISPNIVSLILLSGFLSSSITLMESPLALLFLGLALNHYLRRDPLAYLYFSLAAFTRYEFLVTLAVFSAYDLLVRRDKSFQILCTLGSALAVLLSFQMTIFGTLYPQALKAKKVVYDLSQTEVIKGFFHGLFSEAIATKYPWVTPAYAIVVFALAVCIILVKSDKVFSRIQAHRAALMLLFISTLLILTSYLLTKSLIFPWYYPLFLLPFITLGLISYQDSRSILSKALLFVLYTPLLAILIKDISACVGFKQNLSGFVTGARARQYVTIGQMINTRYPKATVLAPEIGGLGYGFKGKIIDAVGLASPEAVSYHPLAVPSERSSGLIGAIPPELVRDKDPDIIVSHDIFMQALSKTDLLKRYDHWQYSIFPLQDSALMNRSSLWGSRYLNVYIKK